MSIDAALVSVKMALLELSEVEEPPPQVRDAKKRLADAIGWLEAITQEEAA
jgi:hypothetical protein